MSGRQRWVAVPTDAAEVALYVRRWWGGATWRAVHAPTHLEGYGSWRRPVPPDAEMAADVMERLQSRITRKTGGAA
jgi:hypothetical protein